MDGISGVSGVRKGQQLTPDEQVQVARLAARDREVRAHEAAHLSAAGSLASGPAEYTYQRGPDGKMYAIGGKVKVTFTSGRTPEETLAKAHRLRAAANAPAGPSGQDNAMAAKATQMEAEAMQQLSKKRISETSPAASGQASTGSRTSASFRKLDRVA